ncbi:hypothetical protein AOLI_G00311390 [Acnodon oligacanthus]
MVSPITWALCDPLWHTMASYPSILCGSEFILCLWGPHPSRTSPTPTSAAKERRINNGIQRDENLPAGPSAIKALDAISRQFD